MELPNRHEARARRHAAQPYTCPCMYACHNAYARHNASKMVAYVPRIIFHVSVVAIVSLAFRLAVP